MKQTTEYIPIVGMHCAGCAAAVTNKLQGVTGVLEATAQIDTRSLYIVYDAEQITREQIAEQVASLGFSLILTTDETEAMSQALEQERRSARQLAWRTAIGAALTIGVMIWMYLLGGVGERWVAPLVALVAYLYVAGPFHWRALKQLRRGVMGMDTLVSLSTTCSVIGLLLAYGSEGHQLHLYLDALVMIPAFVLIGKWLEQRASASTASALRALLDLTPREASLVVGEETRRVPLQLVQPGMTVRVRPGEAIPVDGVITSQSVTHINEQTITGEAAAVERGEGDKVFAGTICLSTAIEVRAESVGADTALGHIVSTVRKTLADKPPLRLLADRIAQYFVPAILFLGALTFALWYWVVEPGALDLAARYSISVLVIACPCALGLATPTALTVAVGESARRNILFAEAAALETLPRVDAFLMDKTGTLTLGSPSVTELQWFIAEEERAAMLSLVVSAEQHSLHPLAQAIVAYGEAQGATTSELTVTEQPGQGLLVNTAEGELRIGRASWVAEGGVASIPPCDLTGSLVYVAQGARLVAIIALSDTLTPHAAETMAQLKAQGKKLLMLTGDRKPEAQRIAQQIGIDTLHAELMPQDKETILASLQEQGLVVAMVGDGVNDGQALARADVSIALAGGSDLATSMAQLVISKPDLSLLVEATEIARQTVRTIRFNFLWALLYNVIAIPIAAGLFTRWGLTITPAIAAAAMALSSICVVVNSLLLQRRIAHTSSK